MPSVNFLLPGIPTSPIGGIRVVEEYTRHLNCVGVRTNIVAPLFPVGVRHGRPLWIAPRGVLQVASRRLVATSGFVEKENVIVVPSLESRYVPRADVTVATAWWTAFFVFGLSRSRGRKFHLIQHHEAWDGTPSCLDESYRLPISKLVISKWLQRTVSAVSPAADVHYTPNGIRQPEAYGVSRDIDIAFMTHRQVWKRTDLAVEVLQQVVEKFPEVRIAAYGPNVPALELISRNLVCSGHLGPSEVEQLMARSKMFLHTSDAEGWPLPPAEAMVGGAALVSVKNEGVMDYVDETVARLRDLGDAAGLASDIGDLLQDSVARGSLASAGMSRMRSKYTWPAATSRFRMAVGL